MPIDGEGVRNGVGFEHTEYIVGMGQIEVIRVPETRQQKICNLNPYLGRRTRMPIDGEGGRGVGNAVGGENTERFDFHETNSSSDNS